MEHYHPPRFFNSHPGYRLRYVRTAVRTTPQQAVVGSKQSEVRTTVPTTLQQSVVGIWYNSSTNVHTAMVVGAVGTAVYISPGCGGKTKAITRVAFVA